MSDEEHWVWCGTCRERMEREGDASAKRFNLIDIRDAVFEAAQWMVNNGRIDYFQDLPIEVVIHHLLENETHE